jgi:hypothetical protein
MAYKGTHLKEVEEESAFTSTSLLNFRSMPE